MRKYLLDFIIRTVNECEQKTKFNDCLAPFTLEECDYLYNNGITVEKETFLGVSFERFNIEN